MSTEPWPDDAPPGWCWKCPDCDSWATLGGNAGFHRDSEKHRQPMMLEISVVKRMTTPQPSPAPSEADICRKVMRSKTIEEASQILAAHVASQVEAAVAGYKLKIIGQEEQLKALTKTDCGFGGYVESIMNERDEARAQLAAKKEEVISLTSSRDNLQDVVRGVCQAIRRDQKTGTVVECVQRVVDQLAAKTTEVERLRDLVRDAMKWGINGADGYDAWEACQTGEAMRKALAQPEGSAGT